MDTKTILENLEDAMSFCDEMVDNGPYKETRGQYWTGKADGIQKAINIIKSNEEKEESCKTQ